MYLNLYQLFTVQQFVRYKNLKNKSSFSEKNGNIFTNALANFHEKKTLKVN